MSHDDRLFIRTLTPNSLHPQMKYEHQKFAELRATGKNASESYMLAYGKPALTPSVNAAAARLDAQSNIIAKVKELRDRADAATEAAAVLTIVEKRKWIAQVLRTDVTDLSEQKNKHLIKKITRRVIGSGENAEEVEDIEGYDKFKAIDLDNQLAGDGGNEFTRSFTEYLKGMSNKGMITPTDQM
jgi:hypothetical protein